MSRVSQGSLKVSIRTLILVLIQALIFGFMYVSSAGVAAAQSHPGWWTVIAPESKSLVGIEWVNLRNSAFGDALRAELSTAGSLALPDLPCLMNARDFLIASPPLLAAANGGCSPATLRPEALAQGLKPATYRGFDLWIPPAKSALNPAKSASNPADSALSLVQFSDRVVLIGSVKTLRAAIDRSLAETHAYSPLLIQGARLARTRDLWVVATELPDPLASIFVPLNLSNVDLPNAVVPDGKTLRNFEGGISLREGLDLGAILDAGSDAAAAEVAANIRKSIPQFPAVAKGLQIATNGSSVTLALQVASEKLQSGLRHPDTAPADAAQPVALQPDARPASGARPPPTAPVDPPTIAAAAVGRHSAGPEPPKPEPVKPEPATLEPAKAEPQIIRIFGLDEGPREIVLPPKEPR